MQQLNISTVVVIEGVDLYALSVHDEYIFTKVFAYGLSAIVGYPTVSV